MAYMRQTTFLYYLRYNLYLLNNMEIDAANHLDWWSGWCNDASAKGISNANIDFFSKTFLLL